MKPALENRFYELYLEFFHKAEETRRWNLQRLRWLGPGLLPGRRGEPVSGRDALPRGHGRRQRLQRLRRCWPAVLRQQQLRRQYDLRHDWAGPIGADEQINVFNDFFAAAQAAANFKTFDARAFAQFLNQRFGNAQSLVKSNAVAHLAEKEPALSEWLALAAVVPEGGTP